jgi:hypothetical protein
LELGSQRETIAPGQGDIRDHHVRNGGRRLRERILCAACLRNAKPATLEELGISVTRLRIVFHQQHERILLHVRAP